MAFLNPKDCIPDKITTINGVEVYEYLLKNHNINNISLPAKRLANAKVKITIHNTDDLNNVEDDGRNYTASTINNNMRTVRTHMYIDDLRAWQNLEFDSQNWTCADGNGEGNTTSIALECIMKSENDAESLKARDNCARITAWLCKQYGLTTTDVYTHTYWLNVKDGKGKNLSKDERCCLPNSYKVCPYYIIPQWKEFLEQVNGYLKQLGGNTTSTPKPTLPSPPKTGSKEALKYSASKTYPVPSDVKFYTDGAKNVITKFSYKAHKEYYLSPHFQVKEFASMQGNVLYSDEVKIHNRLIELLEALYAKLDCGAIIVNSGYRTNQHSLNVGGYIGDQHSLGRACDITCKDKKGNVIPAQKVCCALEDIGSIYGIGFISATSVHTDTREKSKKWYGDETKVGSPNIIKLGYKSFHDYFKM